MTVSGNNSQISADSIEKVRVDLNDRSYDILIGSGLLSRLGTLIPSGHPVNRAILLSDENVAPIYMGIVEHSLNEQKISSKRFIIPAGEKSKSFSALENLIEKILGNGVDRNTTVITIGGGVVGDLGGFAASIILRGIPFIQIPTTLLSQIDSAVGGKTAINSQYGKNLVGSFYQPDLVLVDSDTLLSLPSRELSAGYGEMLKYGVIEGTKFFSWLEANGKLVLSGDPISQRNAIATCCRIKAHIVSGDEREKSDRVLLNLGHTFAHALEAESGYNNSLLHGEAVSLGILLAFSLSVRLNICGMTDYQRVFNHLKSQGQPTNALKLMPEARNVQALLNRMAHDKKSKNGQLNLVLTKGIGQVFLANDVPINSVKNLLEDFLHSSNNFEATEFNLPR